MKTISEFDRNTATAYLKQKYTIGKIVNHAYIGVARIFDWGGQITCNDVIRNFQKRKFLWGKDIVEWKI